MKLKLTNKPRLGFPLKALSIGIAALSIPALAGLNHTPSAPSQTSLSTYVALNDSSSPSLPLQREWKDIYQQMSLALLWQQQGDESKALSWQAYNMAADTLNWELARLKPEEGRPTLITDIDETLIDSTTYCAGMLGGKITYSPQRVLSWWQTQPITPRPGASAFIKQAHEQGVEILYLTAREKTPEVDASTINLLKALDLPGVDAEHVKLSSGRSNKYGIIQNWQQDPEQPRKLLLTLGDQFTDHDLLESVDLTHQHQWLKDNTNIPGHQAIMLPNIIYGPWECLSHGLCPHSSGHEHQKRRADAEQQALGFTAPAPYLEFNELQHTGEEQGQLLQWFIHSVDYPFMMHQTYNRAGKFWEQPLPDNGAAVIMDIDGTVFSNDPLTAHIFLNSHTKNPLDLFMYWVASYPQATAQQVPGAKAFIEKVQRAGGEVFFVTNRSPRSPTGYDLKAALLRSMKLAGIVQPDSQHLLMRTDFNDSGKSSKASRFAAIESGLVTGKPVNVAQWIGDRIEDVLLAVEDLNIDPHQMPEGKLAELGRSRFLLNYPLTIHGWLHRLYKKWHGSHWKTLPEETLKASRSNKLQRWTQSR